MKLEWRGHYGQCTGRSQISDMTIISLDWISIVEKREGIEVILKLKKRLKLKSEERGSTRRPPMAESDSVAVAVNIQVRKGYSRQFGTRYRISNKQHETRQTTRRRRVTTAVTENQLFLYTYKCIYTYTYEMCFFSC